MFFSYYIFFSFFYLGLLTLFGFLVRTGTNFINWTIPLWSDQFSNFNLFLFDYWCHDFAHHQANLMNLNGPNLFHAPAGPSIFNVAVRSEFAIEPLTQGPEPCYICHQSVNRLNSRPLSKHGQMLVALATGCFRQDLRSSQLNVCLSAKKSMIQKIPLTSRPIFQNK